MNEIKLEVGDVIFYKGSSLTSKIITKLTKSEYSHVGLVIGPNLIIEANRFVDTRIVDFKYNSEKHTIYRLNGVDKATRRNIYNTALIYNDFPYDYWQVVGWAFRLLFDWKRENVFNRANYLICSELIDRTFHDSGVKRNSNIPVGDVTPAMLLEIYDLTMEGGE